MLLITLKKVTFPLSTDSNNQVIYPDDKSLFKNAIVDGDKIISDYYGKLELTEYTEPTKPNWLPTYHFFKRFPDTAQMVIFSVGDSDVMAGLTMEQRMVFRTFISKINALPSRQTDDGDYAQMIDLNDPDTINGVNYISTVTWNGNTEPLISPEQAQEILT